MEAQRAQQQKAQNMELKRQREEMVRCSSMRALSRLEQIAWFCWCCMLCTSRGIESECLHVFFKNLSVQLEKTRASREAAAQAKQAEEIKELDATARMVRR